MFCHAVVTSLSLLFFFALSSTTCTWGFAKNFFAFCVPGSFYVARYSIQWKFCASAVLSRCRSLNLCGHIKFVRQVAGGGMQPISLLWCLSGIISYIILFDVCVSDGETGSRKENACTCITASSCGDPSDMDTLSRGNPIFPLSRCLQNSKFWKHILEILAYRCAVHRISCWIKVSKV